MSDVITVLRELDAAATELDDQSTKLWALGVELDPVQIEYDEFLGAYVEGLWQQTVENGTRFPSEDVRTRLAHRAMPPELLGRFTALHAQRKRIEKRIEHLRMVVAAKRSILSAQGQVPF